MTPLQRFGMLEAVRAVAPIKAGAFGRGWSGQFDALSDDQKAAAVRYFLSVNDNWLEEVVPGHSLAEKKALLVTIYNAPGLFVADWLRVHNPIDRMDMVEAIHTAAVAGYEGFIFDSIFFPESAEHVELTGRDFRDGGVFVSSLLRRLFLDYCLVAVRVAIWEAHLEEESREALGVAL